jgi:amino-acid N-acetyltransferase
MKFRQAQKKDWPAIKALIALYPRKLMQKPLPKCEDFFVAEVEGKIIGCCALEIYSRRLSEIRSLVIHPKHQKQGIGRKLIAKCLGLAKRKKIFEVLSITGSINLFKHLGFKIFNNEKYAMLKIL